MRKKSTHQFDRTVGDVEDLFERLIRSVGGSYDNSNMKRLRRLSIDGVRLEEHFAERRNPRSDYYDATFVEARETLMMLVDLNLDTEGANVIRRDRPDIEVIFSESAPKVYVEHRSVAEPFMPFERHLDEIRIALEDLASTDRALNAFLDAGALSVRLGDPGPNERRHSKTLAAETGALCAEISGRVDLLVPQRDRFPLLTRYCARVFYHPGEPRVSPVFQRAGGAFDPAPSWIATQLLGALTAKTEDAAGYDKMCRPLWLLLTLGAGTPLIPGFVRPLVVAALEGEEIAPYDRLVVRMSGMEPVTFPT